MFADSYTNLVSGLGTEKDKSAFGRFTPLWLGKPELDSMYSSNWLAQTIINAPAEDMTRKWRRWNAGPRHIQRLEVAERLLGIRRQVALALKQSRLYGGSVIILGDGASDPSLPIDFERMGAGSLKYVTVLSRYEVSVGPLLRDPLDPYFGQPEWYEIGSLGGSYARLHPSRVVRFLSVPPLEVSHSFDGWGPSILQACYDPIRNATAASNASAALMQEAKVDIIKVPNLTQNVVDIAFRERILARFSLANVGKSITNSLLLDSAEEWDQKQVSLSNVPEVERAALEQVAGAADIPLTRFLGTSAKGLNNGGQADIRNYYDALSSAQVNDLQPAMERIDDALIRSALGSRPSDVYFSWNSLWQMDEAEAADIALKKAQAFEIHAKAAAMPASALRRGVQNQVIEDGLYPGLDAALSDARDAGEADAALIVAPASSPPPPAK